jgi:hypothetical protein
MRELFGNAVVRRALVEKRTERDEEESLDCCGCAYDVDGTCKKDWSEEDIYQPGVDFSEEDLDIEWDRLNRIKEEDK